ncbi:hypothetical protein ZYGR_0E00170 [Zygosaccharomyces rouxii]|uniref:ZYRO0B00396p n=2 Tax=Zygosaccharomyces rouxii TaxID=4956 RepID=C5DQI0_ZYGRC|nr:uncharacterized protein ZYRO0B00396g [Zygosaccharomyces rouxii]KAH9200407.1 mitochondrial carrier domain-containing protein [Zygosaccharomyces rouxii]GAV47009.1 hypothetical protein ZYGR_0E00170 [Zygosaccharomyces rouxii]CAR26041.1 ZYRO0B00396p [Zygosaccharomyces rouxii]
MSEEIPAPQILDELDRSQKFQRVFKDVLAGTFSGVAQVLVGQPFDITKVRLQTHRGHTTAFNVIKDLIKNEGFAGFYKGTLAPLAGVGACVSCQFGVNEAMKRYFHARNGSKTQPLTLDQYYACGAVSGAANAFLATPIEHVRIRLQLQKRALASSEYRGAIDCTKKLIKQGKLMRGLPATLLRTSHGFGIYFLTYEYLCNLEAARGIKKPDIPTWRVCGFGAIAGALFWSLTYPFDVVKSVMQADRLTNPQHGNTIWQVTKTLYKEGGARVFVKGFTPTILRSLPVNGATFAAFEVAMRILN